MFNKIKQYLDCRYISAPESSWRIFNFKIQDRHPSVKSLKFHLKDQQVSVFKDDSNLHFILNNPENRRTMFTEWFETNIAYPHSRELTYVEFSTKWTGYEQTKYGKKEKVEI